MTPDFVYTSIIPGVYPPPIQIPNIPVPTGISDGNVGLTIIKLLQ